MDVSNLSLFISNNPYRFIGVPSNTGLKGIQKNISKIKAFSKLDKFIDLDFDLSFLNLAKSTRSSEIISKVESRILLDNNKLKYSLFWFQDISTYDSVAIANLIKGNTEKAIDIWTKSIKSSKVNSKNFSSFNNLSTLLILLQLDNSKSDSFKNDENSIKKLNLAITQKIILINSDYFNEFCNSLGVNLEMSINEVQLFFAKTILQILIKNFTSSQLIELTNGLDKNFSEIIINSLVSDPISIIKECIKSSASDLKENESEGISIGKLLIRKTSKHIRFLKNTLEEGHYLYDSIADSLSNQILQCGVICFNKTGDDQSYLSAYKFALTLATSEKTKSRAKEFIKHCKEEKIANICWFCEKNSIDKTIYYRYQMHKWDNSSIFSYNRTYTYFKEGGLKIFCCRSCRDRHYETIFSDLYYYFKGIERDKVKSKSNSSLRRHPLVLQKIKEGYEPGLPN